MNRETLNSLMEPIQATIAPEGYRCIEVDWVAHERALQVFVDFLESTEATIQVDDCVKVSKLLEACPVLDQTIPGEYNLEVSSPGVERPLRRLGDFEGQIGKLVFIKLQDKIQNRKQSQGRLKAVSAEGFLTVAVEGAEDWVFPLSQLKAARLVFNWDNQ